MTESLADGADWHLRSWFCSGLSLFSTVDIWSGSSMIFLHGSPLLDWRIPLIQFLRIRSWWRCRWICKNVSRYTMCVPNAWPSLRRGDTKESLNNPSSLGCFGNNIGWLVTWEIPLRTDSASWKSLGSFIQFTSFCNSCNLPDNSKIVF